jgi:hypothetical protein
MGIGNAAFGSVEPSWYCPEYAAEMRPLSMLDPPAHVKAGKYPLWRTLPSGHLMKAGEATENTHKHTKRL